MSTVPAATRPAAAVAQPGADQESSAGSGEDREASLMSTAQREQIVRVLRQVAGNKAAAAKQLGLSRRSLYRWIDRLGIPQ